MGHVNQERADTYSGSVSYAYDVVAWSTGRDADEARSNLEAKSRAMTLCSAGRAQALNAGKTQIMWVNPPPSGGPKVIVNGANISPSNFLKVLGVSFDTGPKGGPLPEVTVAGGKGNLCDC